MANLKELDTARPYFRNTYGVLLEMETSNELGKIIDDVSRFMEKEGRSISTSQLRNIFAKIKPIEKSSKGIIELQLLRPQLAYTAARQNRRGGKAIIALLDDLIQKVKTPEQLQSFKTFAESVVAYHKYHHS